MKHLPPIYSKLDEVVDLREAIEAFVVSLSERIDGLQDAHSAWDRTALRSLCASLGENASKLGYPQVTEVSEQVLQSVRDDHSDEARKGILELTELVQRIRRGSRAAA